MSQRLTLDICWSEFYRSIRDDSWPAHIEFENLQQLPESIQHEIWIKHFPAAISIQPTKHDDLVVLAFGDHDLENLYKDRGSPPESADRTIIINGIEIHYSASIDGNGIDRQEYFSRALQYFYPGKCWDRCLEWCSGPGFIGFGLLGAGLINDLTLADCSTSALEACKVTAKSMPNVDTRHIQSISDLPTSDQFDLIVANPPWYPGNLFDIASSARRRFNDPGLSIHRDFFDHIDRYLDRDGLIMLVEGSTYTGPRDFQDMITRNGFKITAVFKFVEQHWFMMIQRQ